MRSTFRAFTLIELLVVIAIIAILMAILLPVLGNFRRNAKESATRALIKSLETACAAYEFDWGFFPPDGHAPPAVATQPSGAKYNVRNSASLFYHLTTPFRVMPNAAKDEVPCTKDSGGYLDVPAKHQRPGSGGTEIVDVWMRPLQYDNIRDPQTSSSGFDNVGAGEIRTSPLVANPGNAGRNKQGFDLFSLGDGGDGTPANAKRPVANFKCAWE
jgi:prepilin-type N-terminal cleavage/methylation domain-containing protein